MDLATVGQVVVEKCTSEVRKTKNKKPPCNKGPAADLGQCVGETAQNNLPNVANTTFLVVLHLILNGNNDHSSSMQLQPSYMDVRHWEKLIDLIKENGKLKELYYLTAICKSNLAGNQWMQCI
jgi:hypothetical protein